MINPPVTVLAVTHLLFHLLICYSRALFFRALQLYMLVTTVYCFLSIQFTFFLFIFTPSPFLLKFIHINKLEDSSFSPNITHSRASIWTSIPVASHPLYNKRRPGLLFRTLNFSKFSVISAVKNTKLL